MHSATFACRLATYVIIVCVPTPCSNAYTGICHQDPYLLRDAYLRVNCLKKLKYVPSDLGNIASVSAHVSATNKITACTTAQ